jgi:hypothetical protein
VLIIRDYLLSRGFNSSITTVAVDEVVVPGERVKKPTTAVKVDGSNTSNGISSGSKAVASSNEVRSTIY